MSLSKTSILVAALFFTRLWHHAGGAAQVAMDGDTVVIHYICRDEEGNVVDDSAGSEDPVSFEVGAGEITGNPLFQAFDEAIRGLPLGSTTILEAKGGDWKRELFFEVHGSL